MRLIDADELIRKIRHDDKDGICWEIYHAPTIDAELVRRGHWVDGKDMMYCSECSETYDKGYRLDYNYCPNCGYKMDLEEVKNEIN